MIEYIGDLSRKKGTIRSSILSFGAQNDLNSIENWNPKFHSHTTIING